MSIKSHPEQQAIFTRDLLTWHKSNARSLPWKNTSDPYKIWVSEIILQQTRVHQGIDYYLNFTKAFPNIRSLAQSDEDKVLKMWEGLGYYSRARNLHKTAKIIFYELDGVFPNEYEDIISLPGIGPYTAAAIASFAFDQPYSVVDGNVIRVLSRFYGIKEPVDDRQTLAQINQLAQDNLEKMIPGKYNQAIMDFGATICTPKKPSCLFCPLNNSCKAYHLSLQSVIPVKTKKTKKRTRHFHYHIFHDDKYVLVNKRGGNDIWHGLYEFILEESENFRSKTNYETSDPFSERKELVKQEGPIKHILTHQNINCVFSYWRVQFLESVKNIKPPLYLVEKKKISTFAFPRMIQKHVIEKNHI